MSSTPDPAVPFAGFPAARLAYTPVPSLFLTTIVPAITAEPELRVTLHLFWLIGQKRGFPRCATATELAADNVLARALPVEAVAAGLRLACERGTLLRLDVELGNHNEALYFLNDGEGRRAVAQLRAGQISLGQSVVHPPASAPARKPSIVDLYEQNVGLVTPILAEQLADAERTYPAEWIEAAFRQAVVYGKRNWRYISAILERWAIEGRDDEANRRRDGGHGRTPSADRSGIGPISRQT